MNKKAESQIVTDQPWSFHGPCRAPKVDDPGSYDFQPYLGSYYHFYIVHYVAPLKILEHFLGHCGSLSGLKGPSWTPKWTLRG